MDASMSNHEGRRFNLRMPRLTRGRLFGAAACLLGGAIAVNATLFQSERHPAPMFRTLAKPTPAKVDLPTPPQRAETEKAAPRGEKQTALAAPLPDPVLRDLQTELAARGYYKGEPDGKGGPATSKAIRDFQFDRRMSVDGVPSEALLSEVRSSRETMKDELFDLVKRAHAPERGDKPAPRKPEPVKAEPAKPARSGAAEHRPAPTKVAAKSEAPHKAEAKPAPKSEAQLKAEAAKKQEAAKKAAAQREQAKKETARVAEKAKAPPKSEAKHAPEPKVAPKAVAKAETAPKVAPRTRLDADAPLRPPANIAEVIARN